MNRLNKSSLCLVQGGNNGLALKSPILGFQVVNPEAGLCFYANGSNVATNYIPIGGKVGIDNAVEALGITPSTGPRDANGCLIF